MSETLHGPVRAACNVPLGFVHLLTITFWCQALSVCVCVYTMSTCLEYINSSVFLFLFLFFLKNSQHIYILQLWHFSFFFKQYVDFFFQYRISNANKFIVMSGNAAGRCDAFRSAS